MPRSSLATSVVVVTGASSGIGHATALAFARESAHVVLAARGVAGLEAVAGECAELGAQTLVVPTDVTDAGAVEALARAAIERFGGIDVWCNIVGVGAVGLFDEVPMAAHRRVIEANLIGHMNGAHAVLPHFRARRSGTLVNMISIGGWAASPYAAAYSASKFGLRGFTEALRAEVSELPGVHVCAIYPTFVDTPGLAHGANYTGRRLRPPPPLLDPREVAGAIVRVARSPRGRAATPVGSVALPARLASAIAPDLVGRVAHWVIGSALSRADPAPVDSGNLDTPSVDTAIDGGHRSPAGKAIAGGAAIGALALAWWAMRGGRARFR